VPTNQRESGCCDDAYSIPKGAAPPKKSRRKRRCCGAWIGVVSSSLLLFMDAGATSPPIVRRGRLPLALRDTLQRPGGHAPFVGGQNYELRVPWSDSERSKRARPAVGRRSDARGPSRATAVRGHQRCDPRAQQTAKLDQGRSEVAATGPGTGLKQRCGLLQLHDPLHLIPSCEQRRTGGRAQRARPPIRRPRPAARAPRRHRRAVAGERERRLARSARSALRLREVATEELERPSGIPRSARHRGSAGRM
jgi:hypothetical protein